MPPEMVAAIPAAAGEVTPFIRTIPKLYTPKTFALSIKRAHGTAPQTLISIRGNIHAPYCHLEFCGNPENHRQYR